MTILTLTMNPTIDMSARVAQVVPERKLRCHSPRHEPGGGGLNVSRALRKLGGESMAYYTAGGHTGQRLGELLEAERIDHRALPVSGYTRQNVIVREEGEANQYRFGFPGPEMTAEDVEQCLETLERAGRMEFLVASGSLPPGVPEDFYARVARVGKRAGARVFVDTSGPPLYRALEEGVFLVKPNRNELGASVGREIDTEEDEEAAARDLVESGKAEMVVVSLGAAGVLYGSKKGLVRMRAPSVRVRSAIGAGDSMLAGIVLGLARGFEPEDAVRFGLASGTAAVRTPGTELCRREDTETLFARILEENGTPNPLDTDT